MARAGVGVALRQSAEHNAAASLVLGDLLLTVAAGAAELGRSGCDTKSPMCLC